MIGETIAFVLRNLPVLLFVVAIAPGAGWRASAERAKITGNASGRFLRYAVAISSRFNPQRRHSA